MWRLIIGMVDRWRGSPGGLNNFSVLDVDAKILLGYDS